MRTYHLFLLSLCVASHNVAAWLIPKNLATKVAKGCATAATCVALLTSTPVLAAPDSPAPIATAIETVAPATRSRSSSIKVDINAPFFLDLVKTREARSNTLDRVTFLGDSVKKLVGQGVAVEFPTDIQGFVRNALAGGASIKVNGQDVAVKVVESSAGELTIQIANQYLPALPFVGLKNTPEYIGAAASILEQAAPKVYEMAKTTVEEGPFWARTVYDLDINIGSVHIQKGLTPVDIVGCVSLGLGAAYAGSYAFYQFEQYTAEREAAENKKRLAEKKKQAAEAAKKKNATEAAKKKKASEAKAEAMEKKDSSEDPAIEMTKTNKNEKAASSSSVASAKQDIKKTGIRSKVKSLFRS